MRPVWPSDSANTYHAQVRPFSWTDREKEQGNRKQSEIVTEGSIHWLGWAVAWEKLGGSTDWHVNQVRMWTRRAFRRQSFTSVHLPLISHAVNEELGGCSGTGVGAATEWEKRGQGQWSARNACVCLDCRGEDGGGDPQEVESFDKLMWLHAYSYITAYVHMRAMTCTECCFYSSV